MNNQSEKPGYGYQLKMWSRAGWSPQTRRTFPSSGR
jgi:hypothetical protein